MPYLFKSIFIEVVIFDTGSKLPDKHKDNDYD